MGIRVRQRFPAKGKTPRGSVMSPGAFFSMAGPRWEPASAAAYENQESLALPCHSVSCFSASSLATP